MIDKLQESFRDIKEEDDVSPCEYLRLNFIPDQSIPSDVKQTVQRLVNCEED